MTDTTVATRHAGARDGRTATMLRIIGVETAEGLRGIAREPVALFFSVVMPVAFFALFASLFGSNTTPEGLPVGASMIATFGAFGVISVMMVQPGVRTAEDRQSGWLRVKQVSGAPIGPTLLAKVLATLPYAVVLVLTISVVSLMIVGPVLGPVAWLRLLAVLVLGGLPFALLGLAVGFLSSANTAVALLNALLFAMAIASGLWLPLELMPGWVQNLAPFLPTYQLGQLALAQLTGASSLVPVLALAGTTAVTGTLAAVASRNLRL